MAAETSLRLVQHAIMLLILTGLAFVPYCLVQAFNLLHWLYWPSLADHTETASEVAAPNPG